MQINTALSSIAMPGSVPNISAPASSVSSPVPTDSVKLGNGPDATPVDMRTAASVLFAKDNTPPRWNYRGDSEYRFPPAVAADGKTVYLCNQISVACLDGEGNEKWKEYHTYGSDFEAACTPDGRRVFVLEEKTLRGMPRDDVSKSWSMEFKSCSSPALGENHVLYVTDKDRVLHLINPETGSDQMSKTKLDNISTQKPLFDKAGNVYVLDVKGKLHCFDKTGALQWKKDLGIDGKEASFAVGPDGSVYYHDAKKDANLHALGPDRNEKWQYPVGSRQCPPAAFGPDGIVYVTSREQNNVHAIDEKGSKKWAFPFPELDANLKRSMPQPQPPSPVAGADGTVYACDYFNRLFKLDPETGTTLKEEKVNSFLGVPPTVTKDGDVFLAACTGELDFFKGARSLVKEKNEETAASPAPPEAQVEVNPEQVSIDGAVLKKRKPKI